MVKKRVQFPLPAHEQKQSERAVFVLAAVCYYIGKGDYSMRSIILYVSIHHQNTAKVARALAEAAGAELVDLASGKAPADLKGYDLVGFGSGIYFERHHRLIFKFLKTAALSKKCFIFSTCGLPFPIMHWALRRGLKAKGVEIVGELILKGLDTVGPLAWFGGLNKGHPNEKDLEKAREFIKKISA